jgi:hypothetical protein
MGNTCELTVGRLLEIRVADGYKSVADVDHMIHMIQKSFAALKPEGKIVIAADWRAVQMMSPDTAARAREMLAGVNPRVIRSSILTLPENPLTNLQVVRLIREAENTARRHFSEPRALVTWLAEILTPAEVQRLRAFLALPEN